MIEMLWRKPLLSTSQLKLLHALANGASLKSHRFIDGAKMYQLHPLDGVVEPVDPPVVEALLAHGFITSNQKFPVATFTLTESGHILAAKSTLSNL